MDTLLLGITVVSLIVGLVASVTAWRLMRDETRRAAARIAALSAAADDDVAVEPVAPVQVSAPAATPHRIEKPRVAPWAPAPVASVAELPLNQARVQPVRTAEPQAVHATGFLGSSEIERSSGNRQRGLAIATVVFFITITGGFIWTLSGPEGTSAVAVGPNSPLELVSLSHARENNKLAVSGLVRNPATGHPVEKLSAVVFLFDRMGTFVTSSRAHVDFLKLGAGDESPFVVSIEAPATVARYRVSFRTDDGVVPHIDRRSDSAVPAQGEQPVNVRLK